MSSLLAPKAVAVWLVDNTSLTFAQIANACGIEEEVVELIADGEISSGLVGCDPTITGEIAKEEIARCMSDANSNVAVNKIVVGQKKTKGKRAYSSIAKRKAKPEGVLWLISNHPQLGIPQIVTLIGTTTKVVSSIKDSSYWNMEGIKPRDPILLKLCTQEDLDDALLKVDIAKESEERVRLMDDNDMEFESE